EFLLTQLKPNQTNEVWMGFKSNFKEANTQITTKPINIINGRPLIKTKRISDQVEIHCADKPKYIQWKSGKYIGYGKVNGKRPFFSDEKGKADMVDVPTDVVFIPDHIIQLTGPIVEVNDERVKVYLTESGKYANFTSDFMDKYIWFTDWYTDWKKSDKTYNLNTDETITIEDPIDLHPEKDPYYDAYNTLIDKVEVITTNAFVDAWADDIRGKYQGYNGEYYHYPFSATLISESFQVTGDYHEMIQRFTIKEYMTTRNSIEIDIQESAAFTIMKVEQDGELLDKSS